MSVSSQLATKAYLIEQLTKLMTENKTANDQGGMPYQLMLQQQAERNWEAKGYKSRDSHLSAAYESLADELIEMKPDMQLTVADYEKVIRMRFGHAPHPDDIYEALKAALGKPKWAETAKCSTDSGVVIQLGR